MLSFQTTGPPLRPGPWLHLELHAYEDCEALEASLKRSIEEESRVSLLQSVADQYPYFGSPLIGVPEMAAEDGAVATQTKCSTAHACARGGRGLLGHEQSRTGR